MSHLLHLRLAAACGVLLIFSAGRSDFQFQGMGGLPNPDLSAANGVSADGRVVAGSANVGTGFQAVRWVRGSGFTTLGGFRGWPAATSASGISPDGDYLVGQVRNANGFEAYLWSKSGMIGLGDLPGPGGFSSFATAVSRRGNVVVGASQRPFGLSQYAAFRWTPATGMQPLGEFPGGDNFSIAFDVAADGSVIVGSSSGSAGQEAFIWTVSSGMVGLGDLPGGYFSSRARAVSADGTIVVGGGNSSRGSEAFRWTSNGGMVGLGDFPGGGFSSSASDVSDDGNVIVGTATGPTVFEAFIWTPEIGMVSLKRYLLAHGVTEVEGWNLLYVNGVSADGKTIVGTGINPQHAFEGWVVDIEIDSVPIDMGEEAPPAALSVPLGHVSGGLPEVVVSDDQYLHLRARGNDLMQVVFEGAFTQPDLSQIQLEIESFVTRPGTQRRAELFDFASGNWVLVDTRNVPTWEGFSIVIVTGNVSRFVEPQTLRVRSRVTWQHPTAQGGQRTDAFTDTFIFTRVP